MTEKTGDEFDQWGGRGTMPEADLPRERRPGRPCRTNTLDRYVDVADRLTAFPTRHASACSTRRSPIEARSVSRLYSCVP